MLRPLFLTRASIGLAASAVEAAVALPARTVETVSALPGLPVKVAGSLVQSYLHAGQALTELALKGDAVIATVFPPRSAQPEWATFDEDVPVDVTRIGEDEPADRDVPIGRITPRDA